MRAVVQRVDRASVTIDGNVNGKIEKGFMVLIGIDEKDEQKDLDYICDKLMGLRIFEDEEGKMNRSIIDAGGSILLISQFTLYGDARKGKRPSFIRAARPEKAIPLYEAAIAKLSEKVHVETGIFGAEMKVELVNDGPVTILLDSERTF
ncbi:MAG TPA: D-aminoacyl-tRNA deacylase [Clostridia bacterium]|jgi:D-tyrosyl-tRNA(Tyr) deacylase|nr:D-aminoacyl-tRNA deacylase [Clostridiales bacterium]MDD6720992.1 D-aminoacyl-tRNA deacylase [Clostridiales bacterium]HZK45097.1 D-aminoacyl-tRNA deacylase [Clostridia bacterium]